jgi:hypothetical protein
LARILDQGFVYSWALEKKELIASVCSLQCTKELPDIKQYITIKNLWQEYYIRNLPVLGL